MRKAGPRGGARGKSRRQAPELRGGGQRRTNCDACRRPPERSVGHHRRRDAPSPRSQIKWQIPRVEQLTAPGDLRGEEGAESERGGGASLRPKD